MSRKHSSEQVECQCCFKGFHPRYDLIQRGLGKYCSVQCSNIARQTKVNEKEIVTEYQTTTIGIKTLAAKHKIGQPRAERILQTNGVNTSLGKCRNAKGSAALTYRTAMEQEIGRRLETTEWVHHIDGDRTNNQLSNLCVMTEQEHKQIHRRIEQVTFDLLKAGLVTFNHTTLKYELTAKLKEIM